MLKHFDHVTVAVSDPAAAIAFFTLLGFAPDKDVIIKGPEMDQYMGIDDLEARHITLVLRDSCPRLEVQLLHFLKPAAETAGATAPPERLGFHHICFAVSGIDDLIDRVTAAGLKVRNQPMTFHDRKLVFLEGPDGITVELAEWT
ncbi:VOC family protein [Streptomyces sp. NBC_01264]|uniref:VOC family protein n=1 Tax=Streptomyces sp. NBC_01264 TaxID=2903804 RepID=UPI00224CE6E8|nr:VOC family protein [Streptomyces sp. NBC_01264]MCX4781691.1 VOC family protein [Streptomyces sp. NBC_01264]